MKLQYHTVDRKETVYKLSSSYKIEKYFRKTIDIFIYWGNELISHIYLSKFCVLRVNFPQ